VDFFGLPSGITAAKTKRQLGKLRGELRYMGRVDGKTLGVLRKEYAYSLVVWKPLDDNHFYAAPNKFFEALASGVPVITAPHPQCKTLVERYGCGIVLRDWSLNGFVEGIQQAVRMAPTERFGKMVEGCLEAVRKECNWEAQFAKVIPLLPT
jgi:glycosyltransferase involved in cell wall biosynthesis